MLIIVVTNLCVVFKPQNETMELEAPKGESPDHPRTAQNQTRNRTTPPLNLDTEPRNLTRNLSLLGPAAADQPVNPSRHFRFLKTEPRKKGPEIIEAN